MEVVVIGAHVGPDDIRGLAAMPVGKDARELEAEDLHEEERRDQSHDVLAALLPFLVKQVLIGIQDLLDNPNPNSPAQADAYHLFISNRPEYDQKVKEVASKNPAP